MADVRSELLLSHVLAHVERRLTSTLAADLEPAGVSLEQWRVLSRLSDRAGHHMGEIAEFAMLPGPTLTKVVDRLVAANLVHRRADVRDRRRVLVALTPRGAALVDRLQKVVQRRQDEVVALLGPEDAVELARILGRLHAGLSGEDRGV